MAASTGPAAAQPVRDWLIPPVDAPIERGFDLPEGQFGPGNRGVDYAVASGARVRAAGGGTITFAGRVPDAIALTIDHGAGLETTYTGMSELFVRRGETVDQGHFIGSSAAGLHFGVKLDDVYVDPRAYLGPIDTGEAVHLIPLAREGLLATAVDHILGEEADGRTTIGCTDRSQLKMPSYEGPPNDNVVVMIGGINTGWRSGSTKDVAGMAADLGFSANKSYVFSYSGDPDSYQPSDTFADIRHSARRLEMLMRSIARSHPTSKVDILAHSQGGLVARYYMETTAQGWDAQRPAVDHLVTLATPHRGAPGAGVIEGIAENISGELMLKGLHEAQKDGTALDLPWWVKWARPELKEAQPLINWTFGKLSKGLPDPYATSIAQLTPGSTFLENLSTDDVVYGTRVLALQGKFDAVVPADHALWPGETNRGIDGGFLSTMSKLKTLPSRHSGIVGDSEALTMTHAFLRDARRPCLEERDHDIWRWGSRISGATELAPTAWMLAEEALLMLIPVGKSKGAVTIAVDEGSKLWRLLRSRGFREALRFGKDRVVDLGRRHVEVLEWLVDQRIDSLVKDRIIDALDELIVSPGEHPEGE